MQFTHAPDPPILSIGTHKLVLREKFVDGRLTVECTMEGDGAASEANKPNGLVTTGYMLMATCFQMFNDGTLLEEMEKRFGVAPQQITIIPA